ncbi:hypothetical protein SLS55_005471 [Diplodia seriata]|uniref:NACHT domain-containing protein n=1 Tax=Diplodia seriata TaxID=420778 RepID=A0ABR3CJ48_9PEZI
MVGIGAGIPSSDRDIRLGDIAVSQPSGKSGGVVQYDLGKAKDSGHFQRLGSLNMPPQVLLTALAKLQAQHERAPSQLSRILEEMLTNNPFMATSYVYQGSQHDRLFEAGYRHIGGSSCDMCDARKKIDRQPRAAPEPQIHYGVIASGNTLIKDGPTRDSIAQRIGEECICFEMEAAGLMNSFPCLVVRGICDYADSHKNDRWQRYAAATAAAYAKELLLVVPKIHTLETLTVTDRSRETTEQLILKALQFNAMNERFNDVSRQAQDTFRWIFEDYPTNTEEVKRYGVQYRSNQRQENMLKPWLVSGSGIFHISGKPGSGKSTLMKYIWRHEQTTKLLGAWAEAHQRELVIAQHFFWKPGSPIQKSLVGLVRSLLFHILQRLPGLISSLFPSQMNLGHHASLEHGSNIAISDEEAVVAFERLIRERSLCATHCFCFFIDGLDEFEEKRLTYGTLVKRLQDWVSASPGAIKLCVSSREFPVFLERFPDSQRIRLQDLTRVDIEIVVQQTLNNELHFRRLKKRYPEECSFLANDIVNKADGVFLWVAMTLKLLCDALESRYTISQLSQKLLAIPTELGDFYQYMLDSIPGHDRKQALCLLSMASMLNEAFSSHALKWPSNGQFTVFRASFLADYFDNPEFAATQPFKDMDDQEIRDRIADTAAQSTACCKGLLEVRPSTSCAWVFGEELKFTHRSVPEFLRNYADLDSSRYLKNIDVADALVQTFLAVIKTVALEAYADETAGYKYKHDGIIDLIDTDAECLLTILQDSHVADRKHHFTSLDKIDMALQLRQRRLWPDILEFGWRILSPSSAYRNTERPVCVSLPHVACRNFFLEYLEWIYDQNGIPNQIRDMGDGELLACVTDIILDADESDESEFRSNLKRAPETLRFIFLHNISPNSDYAAGRDNHKRGSPWETLLQFRQWTTIQWEIIELFLKFGAYHPLWICEDAKSDGKLRIILKYGKGERAITAVGIEEPNGCPPLLHHKGGKAGLHDWVDFEKPDNAEAILRLLDDPQPNDEP